MTGTETRSQSLALLLSLVIGIVILAAAGIAVSAVLRSPAVSQAELKKLESQQKSLDASMRMLGKNGGSHQAYYAKISAGIAAQKAAAEAGTGGWARTTSLVLIAAAIVLLGIALVLPSRSGVLANGVLLGGLLLLLYGVGWSILKGGIAASAVALVVAVLTVAIVGYFKYVRPSRAAGGPAAGSDASRPA